MNSGPSVASPGCRRFRSRGRTSAIVTPRVALRTKRREEREALFAAFDGAAAMGGRMHLRMAPVMDIAPTMHVRGKRSLGAGCGLAGAVDLYRKVVGRKCENTPVTSTMADKGKGEI